MRALIFAFNIKIQLELLSYFNNIKLTVFFLKITVRYQIRYNFIDKVFSILSIQMYKKIELKQLCINNIPYSDIATI